MNKITRIDDDDWIEFSPGERIHFVQDAQQLKEALVAHVEQLENAAKRGCALHEMKSDIPEEKTISVEQCDWTLKDCKVFRRFIDRTFESLL